MRLDDFAHLDFDRAQRTGVPEVVLAEGKADADLVAIVDAFVAGPGRVVVSRLAPERLRLLENLDAKLDYHERANLLEVSAPHAPPVPRTGGRVLVMAAGTADAAVAEEARLMAEAVGCDTRRVYDVGVAGLHRLQDAHDAWSWADVIIVAAGREGALAPVVSGLVDRPVIGLPVSVGYGHAGQGEAALSTMLQSCSPMAVVNIDAGVVAGMCAAQIANRVAQARQSPGESTPPQELVMRREQP